MSVEVEDEEEERRNFGAANEEKVQRRKSILALCKKLQRARIAVVSRENKECEKKIQGIATIIEQNNNTFIMNRISDLTLMIIEGHIYHRFCTGSLASMSTPFAVIYVH